MKSKTLFSILIIFLISSYSYADNVPAIVKKSFESRFPNAKNVKWDKENGSEYEAAFKLKGIKYSTTFSSTGDWMETESPTTFEMLPISVQNTFNDSNKGVKPRLCSKIELSTGRIKYEIEIKKKKKTIELFYEEDGKQIK
ncbi:hypothetical protein BH10BAC5_BH10BAC5_27140 [soil metagenome]